MKLLVVDDDLIELRVVCGMVEKERLGISDIFTANRVQKAREILCSEQIDVVLCDIEMPRENGLELLEWMKQEEYGAAAIILTSHADFQYASRAIRAGTENYLLKPAEDEELNKALEQALEQQKERRRRALAEQRWNRHLQEIKEQYFRDIADGELQGDREELLKAAQRRGLAAVRDQEYLPVLFCSKAWSASFSEYSEQMQHFILKNISYEIFEEKSLTCICTGFLERGILVIVQDAGGKEQEIEKACRKAMDTFFELYGCELCAYPGALAALEQLYPQIRELQERERDNVTEKRKVIRGKTKDHATILQNRKGNEAQENSQSDATDTFDYEAFTQLVSALQTQSAMALVRNDLEQRIRNGKLSRQRLEKLQQNLLQEGNVILKAAGVKAERLFLEKEYCALEERACLSVENFESWIVYFLRKIAELLEMVKNDSSVVGRAELYIREHLEEIENCQDIAQAVWLDADYLSRLFRKSKGISLQKYLNQERIRKAKELLAYTELSVSEIALQAGYKNFSHFSTAFKKAVQMSPVEYRKKFLT